MDVKNGRPSYQKKMPSLQDAVAMTGVRRIRAVGACAAIAGAVLIGAPASALAAEPATAQPAPVVQQSDDTAAQQGDTSASNADSSSEVASAQGAGGSTEAAAATAEAEPLAAAADSAASSETSSTASAPAVVLPADTTDGVAGSAAAAMPSDGASSTAGEVDAGGDSQTGTAVSGADGTAEMGQGAGSQSIAGPYAQVVEPAASSDALASGTIAGQDATSGVADAQQDTTAADAFISLFRSGPGQATIQGRTGSYSSLEEALAAAQDGDTIVLDGDFTGAATVHIDKNVTIVAGEGGASVSFAGSNGLVLDSGKNLVLGSGSMQDVLALSVLQPTDNTITDSVVSVTNGHLLMRDGVSLQIAHGSATGLALSLAGLDINGTSATADIEGGQVNVSTTENSVSAGIAVYVRGGAHVGEISGGTFTSPLQALEVFDGATVDIISGGTFTQIVGGEENAGWRFAVYVENEATVGQITGGTFQVVTNSSSHVAADTQMGALVVLYDGHIGSISGGMFKVPTSLAYRDAGSRHAVQVMQGSPGYDNDYSSIGEISGGTFIAPIALYAGTWGTDGTHSAVGRITGGTFSSGDADNPLPAGSRGYAIFLYNTSIDEISGGTFTTLNGDALRQVNTSGSAGAIHEISGGTFTTGDTTGTDSWSGVTSINGTIDTVSGGVFHGTQAGLMSYGSSSKVGVISNGVFWSDDGYAVWLQNPTQIEPALEGSGLARGNARFKGVVGTGGNADMRGAFNSASTAILPDPYYVSLGTTAVEGLGDGFHYLVKAVTLNYDPNGGVGVMDPTTLEDQGTLTVADNGFTRDGYEFTGWNTKPDGSGDAYTPGDAILLDRDTTLYAQWKSTSVPWTPLTPATKVPEGPQPTPTPGQPTPTENTTTVASAVVPASEEPAKAENQIPATSDDAGMLAAVTGALAAGAASLLAALGLRGRRRGKR